ncbi:sporulation protein [Streptomyces sp. NPDC004539]|uniref:sporulation protein n=1 Tax=Streptomyces sp. NPDC004539 TaxID=3154280 RepID=UPI0033B1A793
MCKQAGHPRAYTNTSWTNWTDRGMVPDPPVPALIARLLTERLGRRVDLTDIRMAAPGTAHAGTGLGFARDTGAAVRSAAEYWGVVNRRTLISGGATFAISHFTTPLTRWLISPGDPVETVAGGRRVGQADVDELREAAEEARQWDARYGGGSWKLLSLDDCLDRRAAPLLAGTYTDAVGRRLFAVTAELGRLAGWSAFDRGHHGIAQRHFIQALRMAKAGGDAETGCYVLTTMALQSLIRGFPSEGVDMAQGAYAHARRVAAPRVLSFAKLAEARAHGKAGDASSAVRALRAAEDLLASARDDGRDPTWLSYYQHSRLASDATEIFRDLGRPKPALAWSAQADPMSPGRYTRATGIRLANTARAYLQNDDLDQGLATARRALGILAGVESNRAQDYVNQVVADLAPRRAEPSVRDFLDQYRAAGRHAA